MHPSSLKHLSSSLAVGRTPSLFISLPVYRWVRVSLSCVRLSVLSVRACVCLSVCQSGRGVPQCLRRKWGPSLPTRLVVRSQALCRTAHLCEALSLRAGAHPTFLWLFDLGQDVPDLPLSQLEDR